MLNVKFILPFLILLFMVSCSAIKPPLKVEKITKPTDKSKVKILKSYGNLKESLENIDAKVGDDIFIRIFKKEKELELWVKSDDKFKLCKIYPICAYSGELGPKLKQGDKQSPEGFYTVTKKQLKPNSRYHLALNIGFPNQFDKHNGRTGTYLMIHGKCSSTGCYAMGNNQIEEIYKMANASLLTNNDSFDVHIFPFKMTVQNISIYKNSQWHKFWVNLKLGYDIFDRYGVVPIVKSPEDYYRFYMKRLL